MATSAWVSRTCALGCSKHEFYHFSHSSHNAGHCFHRGAASRRLAVLSATGFGRPTQTKSKTRTLKEIDLKTVEKTETYKIYVRKTAEGETLTNWEELGVIIVEAGANVETAMKERRTALAAAVNHQYPALRILGEGEQLQYGVQLQPPESEGEESSPESGESPDESPEPDEAEEVSLVPEDDAPNVSVLDVSGKLPEETVPASLRAEDGKVSGRKYKRKFF